jgi:hypothetical protein
MTVIPIAGTHMLQAKKVGRPGQHYILAKPNENQKIDIAMAKVLAHTAVRDVISGGGIQEQKSSLVYY